MTVKCPGCFGTVSILSDLIERHHAPGWEETTTVESPSDGTTPQLISIERRLECCYSGARVRVKR